MKLAGEETAMENTTIRLPSSLKSIIAEAAKEHGRTLSDEIRNALQMHYETNAAAATLKDLQDAIFEHVRTMHLLPAQPYHKIEPEEEVTKASAVKPQAKKSRERREGPSARDTHAATKQVLEKLLDHLRNGEEITAAVLEKETGMLSRDVSKLLRTKDIRAKNTRINGVAGRYFLRELLPDVEKAYKEMASERT